MASAIRPMGSCAGEEAGRRYDSLNSVDLLCGLCWKRKISRLQVVAICSSWTVGYRESHEVKED